MQHPKRPQLLLLLLVLELTLIESQIVAPSADSSPAVHSAASCAQLEALLNNPAVTEVVITKGIVARECAWATTNPQKRHVSIKGVPGATLDLRGNLGEWGMGGGELITLSHITVVGDSSKEDVFGAIANLSPNQHWIDMDKVLLKDLHCKGAAGSHIWVQHLLEIRTRLKMCHLSMGVFKIEDTTVEVAPEWKMCVTSTHLECKDFRYNAQDLVSTRSCPLTTVTRSKSMQALDVSMVGSVCLAALVALGCLVGYAYLRKRRKALEISARHSIDEGPTGPKTIAHDVNFETFDELVLLTTIGKGAFSTVYHATLNGVAVAVKVFENQSACFLSDEPLEAFVGSKIVHPNLVRSYAHRTCDSNHIPSGYESSDAEDQGKLFSSDVSDAFDFVELTRRSTGTCPRTWLIMEYCSMGSLFSAMAKGIFCVNQDRKNPRISAIVQAAADIARAMEHLHSNGVIHGDLKSQNVLLQKPEDYDRDFVCKVGDFGLSRLITNRTHIQTYTCGSVRAMPPELLKDGILTPAVDVYSFGIMLWELLSGHPAYTGWSHQAILHNVVSGKRPSMPHQWPRFLTNLIRDCVLQDYSQRPSFSAILKCLDKTKTKENLTLLDPQPYSILSSEGPACEVEALSIEIAESPRFEPVLDSENIFSYVSQEMSIYSTHQSQDNRDNLSF